MRHFLLRLFQVTTLLIIGTALWGGWYLAARGFTKKWRIYVVREIAKTGFDVSIKRLTLDPFRGLVAREVRVVDPRRGNRVLALVDEVALEINFNNLVQKQPFIESLQLREAELSLPLDEAAGGPLEVHRLNARVFLPPHQLYISQARATIFGIEVALTGRLLNPEALPWKATRPGRGREGGESLWVQAEKIMREVSWKREHPRLEISFAGDAALPAQWSADLNFTAPRVEWRGGKWHTVSLSATYNDQTLDVKQLAIHDNLGVLGINGTYRRPTGAVEGELHCSLDVLKLVSALSLGQALAEVQFTGPPSVQASAQGNLRTGKFQVTGRATLPAFAIKEAKFASVTGGFAWDGARWYAREVVITQETGALTLNARQVPGDFRARLLGSINPNALRALVPGRGGELLREWDFHDPLRVDLSARGRAPEPDRCMVDGQLAMGATTFRGAAMKSGSASIHLQDGVLTYDPLRIERAEGTAEGLFAYDFLKHEVRLGHLITNVMPAEVAVWIDPRLVKDIAPYRFHGPPQLTIDGVVRPAGTPGTRLEIQLRAPHGLDYTFVKQELTLPEASARLRFTEGHLQITDFQGALFGGRLLGSAEIALKPSPPGFHGHVETQGVDLPSLTQLYFKYGGSAGKMDATYDFTGLTNDPRTMAGHGTLKVTGGTVFTIPVFGPLSGLVNGVIPGFGYNPARLAAASFTIQAGLVETRDFLVQGQGFDMLGGGTLDFLRDEIAFGLRINAHGFTGKLLSPISRLLEYEGSGKLSKPQWKAKRLPPF